jgi:ribosomal protein L44E
MQIVLKCAKCAKTTIVEEAQDYCLEVDFLEKEIRFVCRLCKHHNKMSLEAKAINALPSIGLSRF